MAYKTPLFNNIADYNVHFLNPKATLQYFDGEKRPQQNAKRFSDMFQDIGETAPKFIQHLIKINRNVLGEDRTIDALKAAALSDESAGTLQEFIAQSDLKTLSGYLCQLYSDKIDRIAQLYTEAEDILDDWTAEHAGTAKLYDFPAFQDYFLKHPRNSTAAPLDKDHGADDRYALETPLFRICVKSPYSAFSKLFADYADKNNLQQPFKKELLTDLQRARIVCPDQNIYAFMKEASHYSKNGLLHKNSADNMGAVLEDNRLVAPKKMTGHRVFFQKFSLPTDNTTRGSLVELQILPQSIMNVNDLTHILMDKADDLLNVPSPSLEARIHANFLYNLCSLTHRRCAQIGGFNKLVAEELDPKETILNMMHNDQRAEVTSAVLACEIALEDILVDTRNGQDISDNTINLLNCAEQAVKKSVKNWQSSEGNIYKLLAQIDARIDLVSSVKASKKDEREAQLLSETKRLIYDQVSDTNILPPLNVTDKTSADITALKEILTGDDDGLSDTAQKLISLTENMTTEIILGHTPDASRIIFTSLGLANAECVKNAPDKHALMQALNKSAVDSAAIADAQRQEHYENLLNRKRNIEYYANELSRDNDSIHHYIGIQRDIFGNINTAIEYKEGQTRQIDTQRLKNMFAHSYERVKDPIETIPENIRKDIARRIVRFAFAPDADSPQLSPPPI